MATALRTHRKSPLRTTLIWLVGLVGLVVCLLVYVQSRHGFQHLVLPVAALLMPGDLEARDGFLTLHPTLHVEGVTYDDAAAGLSVHAERLVLALSLKSLLAGPFLLVENLELAQAEVQVRPGTRATEESVDAAAAHTERALPVVPLAIRRARVEGVSLTVQVGHRLMAVRDTTLEIDDLAPGGTGQIGLRGNLSIDQGEEGGRWAGGLTLAGTLEISATGRQAKWNATNALILREWPAHPEALGSDAVVLDQTLSGDYDHEQAMLHAFSSLAGRSGERAMGAASLTFSRQEGDAGPVMDGTLAIQDITAEGLNLWLGEQVPVRFQTGQVTGEVQLHAVGSRYSVRSKVKGRQLQGQSMGQTTPPVDLDLEQAGAFDAEYHVLSLEASRLTVSDDARVLLAGTLDRPMVLEFTPAGASSPEGRDPEPQGAAWTLTLHGVDVATMRPWLALVSKDVFKEVRTGRLQGTVGISVLERGRTVDLQASLQAVNVHVRGDVKGRDVGPLQFDNQLQARLNNMATLQLSSWTSKIALKNRAVGEIRASGSIQVAAPARLQAAAAALTLRNLPGEALNPLLAIWSPVRVQHAALTGTATANLDGHHVTWEADLQGRQIQLRLPDLPHATAPTDLVIAQAGQYDQTSGALSVDKATVRVMEGGRAVIVAALDRPLSVTVGRMQDGRGTTEETAAEPITFTVEFHRLGIDQVRSRLALWGADRLEAVQAGVLDGSLQVQWHGHRATVAVDGQVQVVDLRLARGETRISEPMTVRSQLKALIMPPTQVQLNEGLLEAMVGKKTIGTARLSGSADRSMGSTDLTMKITSADLAILLDRLGFLDARQRRLLTGGQLAVDGRVVRPGPDQALAITATVRAKDVRIAPTKDRVVVYAMEANGEVDVDASKAEARIRPVGISFVQGGKPAGTVTVAGTWPLASEKKDAAQPSGGTRELTVTVKGWDGGPIADLFDVAPGRTNGPILVSADMTLTKDPATGSVEVRGKEALGPIRVHREDKGPAEATIHLEHDVVARDEELQVTSLMLTAERPQGVPDRVTAKGVVRLGAQPAAQVTGEVASLDAGWYADLFSSPDVSEPEPKATDGVRTRGGTPAPSEGPRGVGIPPVLDADVGIGAVVYRTLTIGPGRLVAKGTGDVLQATLHPTGFAEGTIDGTVQVAMNAQEPEFNWSGSGAGLNVMILQEVFNPGIPTRFSGVGSLKTSGSGRGQGKAVKKSLSGTAVVELRDGKLAQSPLLAFLGNQTNISQLKARDMDFDRIYTELHVEDGWIRTNRLQIDGSSLRAEVTGGVSLDGELDTRTLVRLGPTLAKQVEVPCLSSLLKTPDGFMTLPFEVKATGTIQNPKFTPEASRSTLAKDAGGGLLATITDLARACRPASSESKEPVQNGPAETMPKGNAMELLRGFLEKTPPREQR